MNGLLIFLTLIALVVAVALLLYAPVISRWVDAKFPQTSIDLLGQSVCASPGCLTHLDKDNVGSVTPARIDGVNVSLIYCKEHS